MKNVGNDKENLRGLLCLERSKETVKRSNREIDAIELVDVLGIR